MSDIFVFLLLCYIITPLANVRHLLLCYIITPLANKWDLCVLHFLYIQTSPTNKWHLCVLLISLNLSTFKHHQQMCSTFVFHFLKLCFTFLNCVSLSYFHFSLLHLYIQTSLANERWSNNILARSDKCCRHLWFHLSVFVFSVLSDIFLFFPLHCNKH